MTIIYVLVAVYIVLYLTNVFCRKFKKGNEVHEGLSGFMYRRYFYPGKGNDEWYNSVAVEAFTDSTVAFGFGIRFGHVSESFCLFFYLCGGMIITPKFPDFFPKIIPRWIQSRDYGISFSKAGSMVISTGKVDSGGEPHAYVINFVDILLGEEVCTNWLVREGTESLLLPEGEYKGKYKIHDCTFKRKRWPMQIRRRFSVKFDKPIPMPAEHGSPSNHERIIKSITINIGMDFDVEAFLTKEFLSIQSARNVAGGPDWVPNAYRKNRATKRKKK